MSYDTTIQRLNKGQFSNLYLLHGEELYLVHEIIRALKAVVLKDGAVDFNFHTFFGGDMDAVSVKDTVETYPMMAQARLIVVKNFHQLKEKELQALMPVLENPVETSVLVLVSEKIDKRKKVFKTILKNAEAVECKALYDNQVLPWIHHIGKNYELQLDSQAASLLHQSVGNNLIEIDNEMRKLQQYLGDRTQVSFQDVSQIVSLSRSESVFELANAIGASDRIQALTRLAQLLDQGQNEVGVLAMITRHFRILTQLQDGRQKGLRGAKLSQTAGIHPYFLKEYENQCENWTGDKLKKTYRALLDTDRALKSSPVSSHIWLENFVLKTCS